MKKQTIGCIAQIQIGCVLNWCSFGSHTKTCSEVVSSCVFFPRKLKPWSWEPKWQQWHMPYTVSWEPKGILLNAAPREKYGPIRGLWRNHDGCRGGGVLLDSRDNIEQGSWWVECTVCCGKDIVTELDLVCQVVILVHSYAGYTDTDWTNQGLLRVFG